MSALAQPASVSSLVDAIERRHASQRAILAEVRDELSNLDAQIAAFLAESAEPRRDGRIFALRVGVALRTVADSIDGAAR